MLAGDCWNHYCNLSENEKLLFLSGKEGVVAFFTRRWYQFKQSLKAKIKDIRDKLTHGSINKINHDQLEIANILLYRITGILILNLLGINEWTLDTKIK
jgi:hypothetical protein